MDGLELGVDLVKQTGLKNKKKNFKIGTFVSSNNPHGEEDIDIGIVVEKHKFKNNIVRYSILWQNDSAVLRGYSTTDIVVFTEFYKMWEKKCQNSN